MTDTRVPPYTDLGVWGENADTVIPPIPSTAVAYRNDTLTQVQNETGELYNSIPDSANFNQQMYIITKFITDFNHHGTVGWSDQVDYIARPPTNVLAAITWADDGAFYQAVQESGPGTGAGAQDPALDVGAVYWKKITSASTFSLDLSSQVPGSEGARLVGTTYKPDPALPAVGRTMQESMDDLNRRAYILHGLTVIAAASFDSNGNMVGDGFNIKNNLAEKRTSLGLNYFSISQANGFTFNNNSQYYITPQREINPADPTNLLTSNCDTIIGSWVSNLGTPEFVVIDGDASLKVVFSDPYNINITQYVPFSILVTTINSNLDF